jgi:hypothetical protein
MHEGSAALEERIVAKTPSIKGSVYAAVVEDVKALLASGELTAHRAKTWLEDVDFELLGQTIGLASWYDIRSYDRLNCLLRDVEGRGRNEYLRERGRVTARRLLEAGLYGQLEYLHRTRVAGAEGKEERFEAFGHDLVLLSTLSGSILNFSRWTSRPDPDYAMRYVIEVTEAQHIPETLAWRSDGFVNEMARQHGAADLWRWGRERPDLIVFRMNREL